MDSGDKVPASTISSTSTMVKSAAIAIFKISLIFLEIYTKEPIMQFKNILFYIFAKKTKHFIVDLYMVYSNLKKL